MRRVILAVASTIASLIVLLSYKTSSGTSLAASTVVISSTASSTTASAAPTTTTTPTTTTPTTTTPTTAAAAPTTSAATTSATTTVTGDAVDTRYGPVQVKITVVNGKVTAADAVTYPTDNPRDQEINSYAIPALDKEAVSAGTASIDSVSGATYTSTGYISSLQSALDKAGL